MLDNATSLFFAKKIRRFFILGIKKIKQQQQQQIELNYNSNIGCGMTLGDYMEIMYPRPDESGYIAIAQKNPVWQQEMYATETMSDIITGYSPYNLYLSVNTYYIPVRKNGTVRHLNALYVDIDTYNAGVGHSDILDAIDFLAKTERLPVPTFVIDSGRGMYLIYKIHDVPGGSLPARRMYQHIQSYIVDSYNDMGADYKAKDIARVLRLPGSINTKNNKMVQIVQYNPAAIYHMSDFREYVDPFDDYSPKAQKSQTTQAKSQPKSQTKYIYNIYTLYKNRISDIAKICEMRDYDMVGQRDTVLYIYYYYQLHVHHGDKFAALKVTKNLNNLFAEPLPEKELESYMVSANRAYAENKKDNKKGYNFKTQTLINLLEITPAEQSQLKTIISAETKNDRDKERKKKQRRNSEGLTSRDAQKKANYEKIIELYLGGYKQTDIATKIGVSKGFVSQCVKKYKETL